MTTSRTLAVLCTLCALGALAAHAKVLRVQAKDDDSTPVTPGSSTTSTTSTTTTADPTHPYCRTCDGSGARYQLIRGADEVALCDQRLYCDCQDHKQLQCWQFMAFNPDKGGCALGFSCTNWLAAHPVEASTTMTPTTMTPTTASPATRAPPTSAPGWTTGSTSAPGTGTVQTAGPGTQSPPPAPSTTARTNSAWSNRAAALVVVCLAAMAAL